MENPAAYVYTYTSVVVFGIIGNILVIISILRQRRLLKNNYYFLVLHLAICDLGWLVVVVCTEVQHELFLGENGSTKIYCLFFRVKHVFHVAGIYMMLIIAVLRYRATVHPLKSHISRQKLKIFCGLGYILGLIAGYGPHAWSCIIQQSSLAYTIYRDFKYAHFIFLYNAPTVLMAVLYHKVYRALMNHKKTLKSLGSNPVVQSTLGSSFPIVNYIKNHRTFLVCVRTVLCYGVGNLPMSAYFILKIADRCDLLKKHVWIWYLADVLRTAGSCSANPLIYGIFDKKLLKFWRICCKKTQHN